MGGSQERAVNLVVGSSTGTVAFGLTMVVFGNRVLNALTFGQLDVCMWGGALPPDAVQLDLWFGQCIGSLTVAVAYLIGMVAHIPLRRGEAWARLAIRNTVGGWWVLAVTSSLVIGSSYLVIIDILFALAFLVPLYASGPAHPEVREALPTP